MNQTHRSLISRNAEPRMFDNAEGLLDIDGDFLPWQDDGTVVLEDPSVQALVEDALSSTQTAARQRIERYREKQWLRQQLQGLDGFSGNSVQM